MESFLLVLHVALCFFVVIVILMQSGQGGGLGAGFNNTAALGQEVFGGRGAAGFLVKLTVVLGATFMITSMALAWYSSKPQSALDLRMESDVPTRSQVHEIIEEGSGSGGPAGAQQQMPSMPGDGGDAPMQIDLDGDGEIPDEIRQQLEQMQLDTQDAPVEIEEVGDPVPAELPGTVEPAEAPGPGESLQAPEPPTPVESAPAEEPAPAEEAAPAEEPEAAEEAAPAEEPEAAEEAAPAEEPEAAEETEATEE